jgi:uncharacterized membrane protein YgcG
MKIVITLLSFPALIWAYYSYPFLNQFSWKWLVVAFLIYCFLLIRICIRILESPEKYSFGHGGTGGGYFDGGGGDCGGGGGDC